jgi:hypothetical protein
MADTPIHPGYSFRLPGAGRVSESPTREPIRFMPRSTGAHKT